MTLFAFLINYSAHEKRNTLIEGAKRISSFAYLINEGGLPDIYMRSVRNTVTLYSESTSADVCIFDNNGNLVFSCFLKDDEILPSKSIDPKLVAETVSKGQYYSVSGLSGFWQKPRINAAVPFNNSEMRVNGVVMLSTGINYFTGMVRDMIYMLTVSLLLSLLLAFFLTYINVRQLIRPLKEMNSVAGEFASGNFNTRLKVRGDDELAELSHSFNHLAASLAELDRTRTGFISDVSHELKTPITTINGFLNGILDGTIDKDKHEYYLCIVSSEIKRLSRLVNSLLDVSKISEGKISYEFAPFNLPRLIVNIIGGLELMAEEKNVTINYEYPETPIYAYGNEDAIFRVTYNILENAIKFVNPGGSIDITVVHRAKQLYVAVRNTGDGIAPDDLPYVFDRFFKADKSRGIDRSGSGLGLYLCKSIILVHGGKIWANSTLGEYAEFIFTLSKADSKEIGN